MLAYNFFRKIAPLIAYFYFIYLIKRIYSEIFERRELKEL